MVQTVQLLHITQQTKDDQFSIADLANAFFQYRLLGSVINSVHSCGTFSNVHLTQGYLNSLKYCHKDSEADLV